MKTEKKITIYVLIAILTFGTTGANADEKPILTINPGGHTAMVNELIFTPDGRELISAGNDKVIRVWDVETGELNRTLRGQVDQGDGGIIYAAALSPNGRTLAVGGYLYDGTNVWIRLFNLASGDVLGALKGHTNVIPALAFSPDGRYLASGSGDYTVRLWKIDKSGSALARIDKSEHVLKGHTDDVSGVAFTPLRFRRNTALATKTNDGERLVSASFDNTLRLWRVSDGSLIRKMTGHTDNVFCVATSPDGRWIASGSFDHTIRLWNADTGEFVKILGKHNGHIATISFSPDSRRLVSVSKSGTKTRVWSVLGGELLRTFDKHDSTVVASAWHPDGELVATAGGSNNDIYVWVADTGEVKHHIVGTGRSVWSVAFSKDGRQIAFGNTDYYEIATSNEVNFNNEGSLEWISGLVDLVNKGVYGPLERTFDLIDMTLDADVTSESGWIRADTDRAGLTLNQKDKLTLEIKRGSRTQATIKMDYQYEEIRCYTFTPSGKIAVGSNYALALYDADGDRIREFVGHTGVVWAVSASPDGRYLASASYDQTIRLWNIETGELLTTIFVGLDREWVAWTPAGYYKASAGGDNLIGWHINQGEDKAAKYYYAYQFSDQFNRPDVLGEILRAGSVEEALRRADEKRRRLTEVAQVEEVIKKEPPSITIIEPSDRTKTTEKEIRFSAKIRSEEKITQLTASVNGVPVSRKRLVVPQPGDGDVVWFNEMVTLQEGDNVLSIFARNKYSTSQPAKVRVTYKPIRIDLTKPNLYLLAIGVSDYLDKQYSNLKFCDDDAKAFANFFEGQEDKLYGIVKTRILTNQDATDDNVVEAFEWLVSQATHKDMVMLFVSGHGVKDARGNYYFFPYNGNRQRLRSKAVPWTEFTRAMEELPCKRMLFMDTCHAGDVTGSPMMASRRKKAVDATEAIRELASDEVGCVVMASSMGRELANEDDAWGHGAFTRALLEGFGQLEPFGKTGLPKNADYNNDGVVYLTELDAYVAERVKELTNGAQHPTTQKPSTVRSFPIAVIK